MKRIISEFRCQKTDRLFNMWFSLCSIIDVWFCIGADTHYLPSIFVYSQKIKTK